MKNLIVALSIVLLTQTRIHAQELPYFHHIANGMELYQSKKYADAGKEFDLAIGELNGTTTQTNFYNAACVWSLAGNSNKAFLYLEKIIDGKMIRGWDDPVEFYDMLGKDADFNNIKSDARWKDILIKSKKRKDAFIKGLKQDIADEIAKIGGSDQQIRLKLDSVRRKDGLNSLSEKNLIVVMKRQDSINLIAFEDIIKRYGWLGPKDVGYKNNQYLFLILQHADLAYQLKYLPMFRKGCKAGKVLPKDLAYLEDRIHMREKKMQQYGSQTLIDKTSKKYNLFPIADVDNVDRRRASVGLESLKSYMKMSFNVDFDIIKYKEELPQLTKKYIN